jgi:hypothetical protein
MKFTLAACNSPAAGDRREGNLKNLGLNRTNGYTSGIYSESAGLSRHGGE